MPGRQVGASLGDPNVAPPTSAIANATHSQLPRWGLAYGVALWVAPFDGRAERLAGRNGWPDETIGRAERLAGRNGWPGGTIGRAEWLVEQND